LTAYRQYLTDSTKVNQIMTECGEIYLPDVKKQSHKDDKKRELTCIRKTSGPPASDNLKRENQSSQRNRRIPRSRLISSKDGVVFGIKEGLNKSPECFQRASTIEILTKIAAHS
jgi:hypothetical protein